MNVIVVEEDSFYKLIEEVVSRIKEKQKITEDMWISARSYEKAADQKPNYASEAQRFWKH